MTTKNSTETISNITKTFAVVTQDELNELTAKTSRGVKTIIDGDKLQYFYRSASGKKNNLAEFIQKPDGELLGTKYGNMSANSPNFFASHLKDLINSKTKN